MPVKLFRRRRYLWAVIIALFLVTLWGAIGGAGLLLTVNQEPRNADAMVVLGGEAVSRSEKATELYRQGYAQKILVVGKNEETLIGKRLHAAGIPDTALWFEPDSANTYENAAFSLPLLQRGKVKSILLVTSWFHSRRAAAVFTSLPGMPEVISVPTATVAVGTLLSHWKMLLPMLKEYPKIVGYWFRYGIFPVVSGVSERTVRPNPVAEIVEPAGLRGVLSKE